MARGERSAPSDQNDRYFQKHFARLVGKHGGKWIVLAEGELIGIGEQTEVPALISLQAPRAVSGGLRPLTPETLLPYTQKVRNLGDLWRSLKSDPNSK